MVGLGDLSCQTQLTRGLYVVLLPFGICILGLFIALVKMNAKLTLPKSTKDTDSSVSSDDDGVRVDRTSVSRGRHMALGGVDPKAFALTADTTPWELKPNFQATAFVVDGSGAFQGTLVGSMCKLMAKYCVVLLVGVTYFMNHSGEEELQKKEAGEEMDFITTLFWTSVIASTVGFGDKLLPRHDDTKWFLTFYFWFASITVASIIRDMSSLYLRYTEQQIVDQIFDSMIWLHKADLHRTNRVSQAEYVLFKLRQLNDVDEATLERLTVRFTELDLENKGMLKIGLHLPSSQQVSEMLQIARDNGKVLEPHSIELREMWVEMRSEFVRKDWAERGIRGSLDGNFVINYTTEDENKELEAKKRIRLIGCHTFDWSRRLWREAAKRTTAIGCVLLGIYMGLGFFTISVEGWPATTGFYVLASTISTVGLGDVAPTKRLSRIGTIVAIPFGLIILGLVLSIGVEYGKSLPPVLQVSEDERDTHKRAVFETLGIDNSGEIGQEDFLKRSSSLGLTRNEAKDLFIVLDADQNGKLVMSKRFQTSWLSTVPGHIFVISMRLYAVVFLGAILLLYVDGGASRGVTWIDAFYFATVVATSVGYGDIAPQTMPGRFVMGFFFFLSTLITAGVLRDFIEVYIRDYEGEKIVRQIIDSTTWIHKADMTGTGIITESDYVLFQLQQLQMVSQTSLDNLVDRFCELDLRDDGYLDVGVDLPSVSQITQLQAEVQGTSLTLAHAWRMKQASVIKHDVQEKKTNILARKWRSKELSSPPPSASDLSISEDTPSDLPMPSPSNLLTQSPKRALRTAWTSTIAENNDAPATVDAGIELDMLSLTNTDTGNVCIFTAAAVDTDTGVETARTTNTDTDSDSPQSRVFLN
eukprot:CAMPEP_0171826582 /NCGR_PEP_ID=MMETSP0992-20121227/6157_1 /TAXON_ID=483369 /ORGANISM="non described non described, Strain CCMP2098" /LENGTH=869 /DNA_ID=CAMNT_0012441609 /DNA_START=320 /DNA_END=2929 /DNA_ORIENTATION=-